MSNRQLLMHRPDTYSCPFQIRDKTLYQIKETPVPHFTAPTKPKRGLACKYCVPSSDVSILLILIPEHMYY